MRKIEQFKIIVVSLFLAIGSIGVGVVEADIVTSTPAAASLSNALDGNTGTYAVIPDGNAFVDEANVSVLEVATGVVRSQNIGSVIDVDFGEVMDISAIEWLPRQDFDIGQVRDFEVLVSSDHIAWDVVLSVQNAPPVSSLFYGSGYVYVNYAINAAGQYLRFHVIESYGNYAWYGPPYSLETSANTQLAEIDFVTAPSTQVPTLAQVTSTPVAHEAFPLPNAFDGNIDNFTMLYNPPSGDAVIDVDFGEGRCIKEIIWLPRQYNSVGQPRDFEVLVSDDGISWDVVLTVEDAPTVVDAPVVPIPPEPYAIPYTSVIYTVNAAGQYMRFHITKVYSDWPVLRAVGWDPGYPPAPPNNVQLAEVWFVTETVDINALCAELGDAVDDEVPPIDTLYKNHGDYVSQVARFVEGEISAMCLTERQAEELSSCVVHVRAQSDVGKKKRSNR